MRVLKLYRVDSITIKETRAVGFLIVDENGVISLTTDYTILAQYRGKRFADTDFNISDLRVVYVSTLG